MGGTPSASTLGWNRSAPASSEVSIARPRPVVSRASRPAATPMQANSAAPALGSGCGTWMGAGRKPGIPFSTPARASARSSTGGSSRQGPFMP